MKDIVSLSINPTIDKSSTVDQVVAERKLRCTAPIFEPGGGGVNVSRAIKKLGGESTLIYTAGGLSGGMLRGLMEEEGLASRLVPIRGTTRESFAVLEESTGRQFRFGMPGPQMRGEEWEAALEEVAATAPKSGFIVASGSLPPGVPADFYAQVARVGKEAGSKVIVDTSGDPLKKALEEGVYLIKPNLREFRELLDRDLREEAEIEAAARELVDGGGCELLVISLGSAGALFVSRDAVAHMRPPTVRIVSKVGAGDSMVAGITLSLARAMAPQDAVLFGIASGAAAVMTPGSELCRREDAERLYKKLLADQS
ncbi:1-phosphofructokinase family hexose kinase [Candidatus Methanocrinis natronophilus]|uniref:1-phosphofructokinase family hexose kinase n=1 Tax=Candidatus Methanocrinis natronophilus TaxID=3033396 RepID=A0ABT5XB17_9EURY|nr:1-phosphofructokinase family hexose kinase [Candidatus Methanocrinis natronophilus]MDF0591884.1 1-phosphofructokinase family hexose kinase [Candidatus Methanocrinis natronophilus]